jgi:hypothetical protein
MASGTATVTKHVRLTNLAHLDWLGTSVTPEGTPRHSTYRLDAEPSIGMVWTYGEHQPDGGYRRVGGGRYDRATDRYGQGAFNTDDVARAAVVYLRHWRATGSPDSRTSAYQLLRGLAYLQTVAGPHAGNVVLWMQPDGTLNPVADPPEQPAPSDTGPACWLARTIWALGEGYAAFRCADPPFAVFLRGRLMLALDAVQRQSLVHYGQWHLVYGARTPAWLIADAADATGEALLGLVAYAEASGDTAACVTIARLAEGVAAMGAGDPYTRPFGAILPWARSRTVWHAWGALAPAGLAAAYAINAGLLGARRGPADAASFTPHLLVATGPTAAGCRGR